MAQTTATNTLVVSSITDVQGPDGIRYKRINGVLTADTGTTKLLLNGNGGFFYPSAGGVGVSYLMKASGAGTLPAVGDSIAVVIG